MAHEERVVNLCVLLQDEDHVASVSLDDKTLQLPSNNDPVNVLNRLNNGIVLPIVDPTPLEIGALSEIIWQQGLFLGYITAKNDETLMVVHLERVNSLSDKTYQYPKYKDCQCVALEQVLSYLPTGDWDATQILAMKFILTNTSNVQRALEVFVKNF